MYILYNKNVLIDNTSIAHAYIHQVKCPPDYRARLQTLYILFGTKFSKIFSGPLWSHAPIMQAENIASDPIVNPVEAMSLRSVLSERAGTFTIACELIKF